MVAKNERAPFTDSEWNALFCAHGLASNTCGCERGKLGFHDDSCVLVEARSALERVYGGRIPRLRLGDNGW